MYNFNQTHIIDQIQKIINCSRCGDELFFTDCEQAATDILKYLERENILRNEVLQINSLQNKAA